MKEAFDVAGLKTARAHVKLKFRSHVAIALEPETQDEFIKLVRKSKALKGLDPTVTFYHAQMYEGIESDEGRLKVEVEFSGERKEEDVKEDLIDLLTDLINDSIEPGVESM